MSVSAEITTMKDIRSNRFLKCWDKNPLLTSLAVGVGAWCLSISLYFSWVRMLPENRYRWDDFLRLCENPFNRELVESILYYRISVPLVAYVLHLPPLAAFAIQYIALILTLSMVFWLIARKFSPISSFWFVVSLALTSLTVWVNSRPGFADSVTHLIAATCMLPIPPLAYIPLLIFGAFNDERMLLALPFILFWKFPDLLENKNDFINSIYHGCCILMAIVLWGVLRHMLTLGYIGPGIETPEVYHVFYRAITDFMPCGTTWPKWFWNVLVSYRWLWALWILALATMGSKMHTKVVFALSGLAVIFSSMIVGDVSKSICFSFGMIMVSIIYLARVFPLRTLNRLLMGITALQIFTPMGFFQGCKLGWLSPPIYKLIREIFTP